MTALDKLRRQRLVLQYWIQNVTSPKVIVTLLSREPHEIHVSVGTIRRDIRTMEEWVPQIVRLEEDKEVIIQATTDMMTRIRFAQDRLAQLAFTGDNSNAQVGAAKALIDSIKQESELRSRIGQLEPKTLKIEQSVESEVSHRFPEITAEDIARYQGVLFKVALDTEARELNDEDDKASPEESLDSVETSP